MAFDSRNFQDKILQCAKHTLFSRYNFLRIQLNEAVMDLSKDAGIDDGIGRIANGLKWIINNPPKRRPGVTLTHDIWDARRILTRQGVLLHESKSNRKPVTDDDLIKNGLTEDVYYDTLDKVLNFIAWAYDIQIYQQINNMVNSGREKTPHVAVPEEELNRLSIESLAQNPAPRILVIFVLDNGVSMDQGGCLKKLDQGLTELIEVIRSNSTLTHQLELYIVTAGGGAKEIVNFDTIDHHESQLNNFIIRPFGRCMMASAIELALQRLDERIQQLRDPEVNVDLLNCPWMIVLSNGRFAQDMTAVNKQLIERINSRKLMVYWRAVSPAANMEVLQQLPAQESGKVKVLDNVNGFFSDINTSLKSASQSVPGCHVELRNTRGFVE